MKIFGFENSEGTEIIAANSASEATTFFFTQYIDDRQINEMCEFGGIKIDELNSEQITKEHKIFDEEINANVEISYKELAEKEFKGVPVVLVTPNY